MKELKEKSLKIKAEIIKELQNVEHEKVAWLSSAIYYSQFKKRSKAAHACGSKSASKQALSILNDKSKRLKKALSEINLVLNKIKEYEQVNR